MGGKVVAGREWGKGTGAVPAPVRRGGPRPRDRGGGSLLGLVGFGAGSCAGPQLPGATAAPAYSPVSMILRARSLKCDRSSSL